MIHTYIKNSSLRTLILLHGTGGNEHDLIPLGKVIDPDAALLGIRGNVLESGMPRFFKRLSFGVFDQESLKQEAQTLFNFIQTSAQTHQFDLNQTTIIGYSNGANILAYMLMHHELYVKNAVMLHPMNPSNLDPTVKNVETQALITGGLSDSMVPVDLVKALKKSFDDMAFSSEIKWFDGGHQLSEEELKYVIKWYKKGLK